MIVATLAVVLCAGGTERAMAATEPSLPTWQSVYDWPGGNGYSGWASELLSADPAAYGLERAHGGRAGLWTWPTGDREYQPGGAAWTYAAPGTTRIARIQLDLAYADKLFAHHCLDVRLTAGSEVRASSRSCSPPDAAPDPAHHMVALSDPSPQPRATRVEVRVGMPVCNNPAPRPCSKWIPALDPLVNGAFLRVNRADMVLVDDDAPAVAASGALRDLDGRYIDGRGTYDVTVDASDAGSGIDPVRLERGDGSELWSTHAACDVTHLTPSLGAALCPPRAQIATRFDTSILPEGNDAVRAGATDVAGNRGASPPWQLLVDRTPPPAPHDFEVDVDDEINEADITWLSEDDPVLADGTAPSGLVGWEYRYWLSDRGWSEWQHGAESVRLPADAAGDEVSVEARALDAVGNASEVAQASLTIPGVGDSEDGSDDPDPTSTDAGDVFVARASSLARATALGPPVTLTFHATSLKQRRDDALAAVTGACTADGSREWCIDAVRSACRVGGLCKRTKQIACSGARVYCRGFAAADVDGDSRNEKRTGDTDIDGVVSADRTRWTIRRTGVVVEVDSKGNVRPIGAEMKLAYTIVLRGRTSIHSGHMLVRGQYEQKPRVYATCETTRGRPCLTGGDTGMNPVFVSASRYFVEPGGMRFGEPTAAVGAAHRSHRGVDGSYRWRIMWTALLKRVGVEAVDYSPSPENRFAALHSAPYRCRGGSDGQCLFDDDGS